MDSKYRLLLWKIDWIEKPLLSNPTFFRKWRTVHFLKAHILLQIYRLCVPPCTGKCIVFFVRSWLKWIKMEARCWMHFYYRKIELEYVALVYVRCALVECGPVSDVQPMHFEFYYFFLFYNLNSIHLNVLLI